MDKIQNKIHITLLDDNRLEITSVSGKNRKLNYLYDPACDSFECKYAETRKTKPKHKKNKSLYLNAKKAIAKKVAFIASAAGIVIGSLIGASNIKNPPAVSKNDVEIQYIPDLIPAEDSIKIIEDINLSFIDDIQENKILKDVPYINSTEGKAIKQEADKALSKLENSKGDANICFDDFCDALELSKEDAMYYVTYLCNSAGWANGCISPELFLADIMQESEYDPNKVGDGGEALGFGQFHTIAVDQVNMTFGTDYTYEDRQDPQKALEMMALYMRYCNMCTGSTDAMLAMYNRGYSDAINTPEGKAYVKAVYGRLNGTY